MGKKDERYGKLEIETDSETTESGTRRFERNLEIFENQRDEPVEPQRPPPVPTAHQKTTINPGAPSSVRVPSGRSIPRPQHHRKQEELKEKMRDLGDMGSTSESGNARTSTQQQSAPMSERQRELLRQQQEAQRRYEQASHRAKTAQDRMFLIGIAVVAIVLLLTVGRNYISQDLIQILIGLAILFIGGGRGWRRYRRW